jgi:5-methylcytosine-specific restriction endonuclease McrA
MKANRSRGVRQGRTANSAEARPLQTMKCKQPNAELVWKQLDDTLVPRLRLWPIDRAAYSYLMRHSRLEGKVHIQFSMPWLARGICVSTAAARRSVRRLIDQKALRLVECSLAGRVAELPLPEEVLSDHLQQMPSRPGASETLPAKVDEEDFLRTPPLREAIHAREAGRCFYCLGRLTSLTRCLDHVVPCLRSGNNSYRNLVSCCRDCNARKGACSAEDFLRSLFRDRKLTDRELAGRLRALDALAAGKLVPPLPSAGHFVVPASSRLPSCLPSSRRQPRRNGEPRPSNTHVPTTP